MENHNIDQYSYDTARNDDFITFYFQEEGKSVLERQSMKIPKAFLSNIKDRITLDKDYTELKEENTRIRDDLNEIRNKLRDTEDLLRILKSLHNDVLEMFAKKLSLSQQRECHCQDYNYNRW